jgi:hypothetical protein
MAENAVDEGGYHNNYNFYEMPSSCRVHWIQRPEDWCSVLGNDAVRGRDVTRFH